jgi:hypothetical protein
MNNKQSRWWPYFTVSLSRHEQQQQPGLQTEELSDSVMRSTVVRDGLIRKMNARVLEKASQGSIPGRDSELPVDSRPDGLWVPLT